MDTRRAQQEVRAILPPMPVTAAQRKHMERAIELAAKSVAEPNRSSLPPKVGVVIARGDDILAEAYRGEASANPGDHAEYIALDKISENEDLSDAEVFTTLEPCSRRGAGKTPCADRLVERGVGTVFIGNYDDNPAIHHVGWRKLRDGGVKLRDFPADLHQQIESDTNVAFVEQFTKADGDSGEIRFEWARQHSLPIETSAGAFNVGWGEASGNGIDIYVYGRDNTEVAPAPFRRDFAEIDNPGVFDFSDHTVSPAPQVGSVLVFRNGRGRYLLVQVLEINAANHEVRFGWALVPST